MIATVMSCKHLQGSYCTKIAGKCLEQRWIGGVSDCLIKERKSIPPRPKPPMPHPPRPIIPPGAE